MNRRSFLASLSAMGAVAASAGTFGCSRAAGEPGVMRVGFLPNLSYAGLLCGFGSGRFARACTGTTLQTRTFRAGPRVAEALLGRAIDIGVLGPIPIVSLHARHPGAIQVLGGCASGGASLVVQPWVKSARDLDGRHVATPQIGSTQDVSLRKWLAANGLAPKERGGTVLVDALASADIFAQMKRGQIAAGWLPEPWGTRVVRELPGVRLVDERDLWPEHRFPAAIMVVRREFMAARRAEVERFVAACALEIERARTDPASAKALVNAELERLTTRGLPAALLDEAWTKVDLTTDPLPGAFAQIARDAHAVGYVPDVDCAPLFV
jgi:NitT/TauT family transport system substrate-binding protein